MDIDISVIAACNERGCIGANGDMPWRCPEDMHHFKEKTTGSVIIGGRKTFESIGKTLPDRFNIILSRNNRSSLRENVNFEAPHSVVESSDQAIGIAKGEIDSTDWLDDEIFFIGGTTPFREGIRRATTIYLSVIDDYTDGDAYLPLWSPTNWNIEDREILQPDEVVADSVDFFTLKRAPHSDTWGRIKSVGYKPITPFHDEFRIRDLIANTDI